MRERTRVGLSRILILQGVEVPAVRVRALHDPVLVYVAVTLLL